MSKEEMLQVLVLLSQMEGFIIGKVGANIPEKISKDLEEVCKMLDFNIRAE